jgi:hypothetical protein
MSQDPTPQPTLVQITFSPLEGCTLKAISLARDIDRCFEIPVRIVEKNDGVFEVTVNGVSIYRKEGVCDARESHEAIFMVIRRYKQPIRNLPVDLPDRDQEEDPQYQAWLRAMCSGE